MRPEHPTVKRTAGPPPDRALLAALDRALGVDSLRRRPYSYATSAPLEQLDVVFADGSSAELILKDVSWDRLSATAKRAKPRDLHDPAREVSTYVGLLAQAGVGPRLRASCNDLGAGQHWIVIEKVPGVELWQVGSFEVWLHVARWLAGFHAGFAAEPGGLDDQAFLVRYDGETLRHRAGRAERALARSGDHRAGAVLRILDGLDSLTTLLEGATPTLVHGEFYPSNILVSAGPDPAVWPVDWEMAGIGHGALDLAALVTGWDRARQRDLIDAYADAAGASPDALAAAVELHRLQYALQWIGRTERWEPPSQHQQDWVAEALDAAAGLGC